MMSFADPQSPLVIIADAHVSRRRQNAEAFFEMLALLEQGAGDVVFLGDIFDLWIALPRYENDMHRLFLSWCRCQKARRQVGFIEGNHEFFVARRHAAAFSWCTQRAWWQDTDGNLFSHGDRINRRDHAYLAFRKLTKNPVARTILRGLPWGPSLAQRVKLGLKDTNRAFRKCLPADQLQEFAERRFREGAVRIFVGHFHRPFNYRGQRGGELNVLPDWYSHGAISLLPVDGRGLRQGPWRELLPILR
jgi:UDP-2,3-diacylglucosamine hydrolase